jgi:hypothetical protein
MVQELGLGIKSKKFRGKRSWVEIVSLWPPHVLVPISTKNLISFDLLGAVWFDNFRCLRGRCCDRSQRFLGMRVSIPLDLHSTLIPLPHVFGGGYKGRGTCLQWRPTTNSVRTSTPTPTFPSRKVIGLVVVSWRGCSPSPPFKLVRKKWVLIAKDSDRHVLAYPNGPH